MRASPIMSLDRIRAVVAFNIARSDENGNDLLKRNVSWSVSRLFRLLLLRI